jgi:uncharacterized Fe-S cluster-containing radical SAM superfamily protein
VIVRKFPSRNLANSASMDERATVLTARMFRDQIMSLTALAPPTQLDPKKFKDPSITAKGEQRASVPLGSLATLWFNTGTLCNLTCRNCYIESSPRNDRLVYLTAAEVSSYLDEIERDRLGTRLIGFTGGEPFMNPGLPAMLGDALSRGFKAMVLTNAMKPMHKMKRALLDLHRLHGHNLTIRVSIDHYGPALHEAERGARTWQPTIDGLVWLASNGFDVHVAGRRFSAESEEAVRRGYGRLFAGLGIAIDARDPGVLVLFPEMDSLADVPEITTACWGILHKSPDSVMCASARMVIKRKDAARPAVVACTLLPYDPQFELGETLAESSTAVRLNHPHCAKFCVLGGAACSQ